MKLTARGRLAHRVKWAGITVLLIALAAVAGWGVYTLPAPVVDRMLKTDILKQSELWKRRVLLHLNDPETALLTGNIDPHDAEFLSSMPEASDVYRFNLFDTAGRIVWSTRPEEIGSYETRAFFRSDVARGMTHYIQEALQLSEIDGLDLHSEHTHTAMQHQVAEVFIPITKNGRFIGAIEFFTDFTDLRTTFITRLRVSLSILSGIALFALASVSLVTYRTNRLQVRALQLQSAKERNLMDEQLRLAREVRLLGELNEWLQSSRSLDELFDMVSRFMTHILPEAEGSVYVYSNSRDVLDGCASWNDGTHKAHIHPEGCWGLRRGRTYEYGASEIDFVCEHAVPHDGRPYFCFPILAHGETVGLLHLRSHEGNEEVFHSNRKLAQLCAEQISMAIANVRMRDQLHDQSVRDPLTGLFNRRHMTETLRKSISRSQQTGAPLSLIAVDVDHFKKFNDTHGHDAGDMVLRAVGSALEQGCDRDEIACRIGGEEFMVILPDNSPEDAVTRAEHLRQAVEAVSVRYGEKSLPRITISVGVAHYPAHGTMPQDLMRASDDALYSAKDKGRNQVQVAKGTVAVEGIAAKPRQSPNTVPPQSAA
ncbi:Stalked cell differentiation-controlling protein [Ruegeria denitrificans]|uniref:diguanylate cyclase n=1 Tax=Ruegeria denitrificans TaxID=1715692 RepID=A0A0P1IMJ5_9RHOB|nr:diguanylate cyclase [Ruegeria denitrificans]CUJ86305.1 Stalked cell differentiation-controlling protein [Ruegeria denitrificans]